MYYRFTGKSITKSWQSQYARQRTYVHINIINFGFLKYTSHLHIIVWSTCGIVPYSLPDPVPLEKGTDGNPIRIDIPEPLIEAHQQDDYVTVSFICTLTIICTNSERV